MLFKRFHNWSVGSPPVQWSGTIYAILEEGIMGNIHVKLFEIWTTGSGGDVLIELQAWSLWSLDTLKNFKHVALTV